MSEITGNSRRRRRRTGSKKKKKIRKRNIALAVSAGVLILLVLFRSNIADFVLINFGECASGRLTDEFLESDGPKPTHSYRFRIEEKNFYGNSLLAQDKKLIGTSMCIIYYPLIPSINRPARYFAHEDRRCFCD